jgi:hypothetical protein
MTYKRRCSKHIYSKTNRKYTTTQISLTKMHPTFYTDNVEENVEVKCTLNISPLTLSTSYIVDHTMVPVF